MDAKWSVLGVITDHLGTLVNRRTRSWMLRDYAAFFAFPVGAGIGVFLLEVQIANAQNLIAGVSVFTALLFGLLVHVFGLGLRVSTERSGEGASRTTTMVDQLHANVAYATLVSLVMTAGLMALIVVYDQEEVPGWASAVVVTVLAHLFMTLLMVLKRMRSMYAQLRRFAPFTDKG
ncbi:hypothetical protein [Nocardiopsis deserti]|uniref:hypothetical protein n=1 Tax=Nocardiopsis deserti TaxID=2605988 RepID=UPI00123926A3|nr:hypothetical protein [Nocardiopsis deserti]